MGGGYTWRIAGQWIEWDFSVPKSGFYNIHIKNKQSYLQGIVSNRAIYIDGEIPFEELGNVPFYYSNSWENMSLTTKMVHIKYILKKEIIPLECKWF